MFGRTVRTGLLIMTAATASLTSLALPTARAVVAALPLSHGGGFPPSSGVRQLLRRSHAQLGDLAAEVACSYLKKISSPQPASDSVTGQTAQDGKEIQTEKRSVETSALGPED